MKLINPTKLHTTVEGRAKTGEVAPRCLVTNVESWDGTTSATAQPAPMHYVYNDDGEIRPMTMLEMIDKGYFIIGRGPR